MDRQNLFRSARKLSVALVVSGWACLALPALAQAATGMQYEPAKGYPTTTGSGGASATDSGATGDDGAAGSSGSGSGGTAGNADTPASSGGGCAIAGETSLPTGTALGLAIGLAALARRRARQPR